MPRQPPSRPGPPLAYREHASCGPGQNHRPVLILLSKPTDFLNQNVGKYVVVSFHLRFKDGHLTDLIIYWLLVSVVHQMFF